MRQWTVWGHSSTTRDKERSLRSQTRSTPDPLCCERITHFYCLNHLICDSSPCDQTLMHTRGALCVKWTAGETEWKRRGVVRSTIKCVSEITKIVSVLFMEKYEQQTSRLEIKLFSYSTFVSQSWALLRVKGNSRPFL